MSNQKQSMSIYHVMLILSAIFMFLATLLMFIELRRWWDTGPKAAMTPKNAAIGHPLV